MAYSVISETVMQLFPEDSGAVFVLNASRDMSVLFQFPMGPHIKPSEARMLAVENNVEPSL